jgi:LmbE family N-acetylglucosaminyl deacetylase
MSYSRYLGYIKPELLRASEQEYRVRRELLVRGWETARLQAPVGKRILALSPHPDDESIGAGGLLWAHRGKAEIHIVCLTDGEKGGALANPPDDPIAAQRQLAGARREELAKVSEALGARSLEFCSFPDGNIAGTPENVSRLRSVIARIAPDVVLLPWFLDNHPDHRSANALYAAASSDLDCLVLGYEIWALLEPNAVFDITGQLEAKLALIRNFKSQLRTVDYLGYATGLAQTRAYHYPVHPKRSGAVECFVALPNREYCDLVMSLSKPSPSSPVTARKD